MLDITRRASVVASLAMLFIFLSACGSGGDTETAEGSNGDSGSMEQVRIGWQPTMNGARYFVAESEGLWAEQGLDVSPARFNSGPAFYSAFQSDSIDVGFMAFPPASIALAQEVPVEIVAVENYAKDSEGLVVRKDSGIDSLEDLSGKKIGYQRGTSGHYALVTALETVGLTADDLELIALDATNVVPAFNRGDIDGAWFWEPWQGLLRDAGGVQIATDSDIGVKMGIVWLAREDWIGDHQEELQKLLAAIDAATESIYERPEDAAAGMAEILNVDPDLALTVLTEEAFWPTMEEQWDPEYTLSINPAALEKDEGLLSAFQGLGEFQESVRSIETKPNYLESVNVEPLRRYLKE